ncbi:MAG: amino acid racemase [Oscillospiraceae bacterium]|jgi:aspartate racemase|nr:amino acid racemase [Oscillospiraceae bacterium]
MKTQDSLGVVGGVGPRATAYFLERLVDLTEVTEDQEHISAVILNNTAIPDRTRFILQKDSRNPFVELLRCCQLLESLNVRLIAIPCNTSHYFYDELIQMVKTPIVHMQRVVAEELACLKAKKNGIMATTGSVCAGLFQRAFAEANLDYMLPDDGCQQRIMDLIYAGVKVGRMPGKEEFLELADVFLKAGCDRIVLGCTELSILKKMHNLGPVFVDTLDAAVKCIIKYFGKSVRRDRYGR